MATTGMQAHKHVAGIIGNEILSKFNIIFDLPTKMMYLEKNKSYDDPLIINCSGMDVQLSEDKQKVLIHQVYENSPASKAGIKVNAELISINGESASEHDMQDIIQMLRKEGSIVELVVKQDGTEKSVSFELKALI
jgi:C-terminal processing protease CtpA/Prc